MAFSMKTPREPVSSKLAYLSFYKNVCNDFQQAAKLETYDVKGKLSTCILILINNDGRLEA